jgi:antitoxin HigA-1
MRWRGGGETGLTEIDILPAYFWRISLMAITLHPSFAVHPGPWLRGEFVEPHGLTVTTAAARLGVTRQAMSNLLNGNSGLSAAMAIRFEKAFGMRAETLLRMQVAHDLAQAREGEVRVEKGA